MAKSSAATDTESTETPTPREFRFQEGTADKFWKIELNGNSYSVTFGRTGTQGQKQTKEFDTSQAARKSYDKLIAEKLKKGYAEAGCSADVTPTTAATSTAAQATSATKKSVKSKTPVAVKQDQQEPMAPASLAAASIGNFAVSRSIDLEPTDWYYATFRQRAPLPRGTAREFDQAACLKALAKLKTNSYGWQTRWDTLHLPPSLSREEAHFWFEAMVAKNDRDTAPQQIAEKLAEQTFDGNLDAAAVSGYLNRIVRGMPYGILTVVANSLTFDEMIALLLAKQSAPTTNWQRDNSGSVLLKQFDPLLRPYLTADEIAFAQRTIRKDWDPGKTPADMYQSLPQEYYLAASLGMHAEVYEVTSSWSSDLYTKEGWSDHYHRPQDLVLSLGTPELIASEWRRLGLKMRGPDHVRAFLACTEYSALDCVRDSVVAETKKERAEELLQAFALVHAPEAAEPMLQCKLESKMPAIARDWLDSNVGCAVSGLLRTAGGRGKLAEAAIDYLRSVQRRGHGHVIVDCLKHVTDQELQSRMQREIVDFREKIYTPFDNRTTPNWLTTSLAHPFTAKPAKVPAWCAPPLLPPLTVGDARLNDIQIEAVIRAIMSTPVAEEHPLLVAVRQHVPGHVRDEFAWKLFSEWLNGGALPKEKWAMGAIGHIGADGSAVKLTPLVRNWPGESQHARAVFGLECLRAIGSDVALMQLAGIAQKLKFKALKSTAEKFVNEIAEQRGMTRPELEDRVIPDCGLDENGRRDFSFGSRVFSFTLGGDLKAMVRDADSKLRGDLPKPSGKDDAAVAAQSVADWKLMKKQIKEVATIQAGRLEQAMVTGRRWSVSDFETLIVRHPLMTHLARSLLWGAFDANHKSAGVFRVTEERDYAGFDDQAFSLASVQSVGVLHPLELNEAERAAWGQVLGDYEIIAPFPQLGRGVFALAPDERQLDDLKRYHRLNVVAPTLVFTLEKLGWARGAAMDAGCFDEHSKQFPAANITAVVTYEGTVAMGYVSPDETLTVTNCQFVAGLRSPSGYGDKKEKILKLADVSPIVVSEVMADMQVLKSKSK